MSVFQTDSIELMEFIDTLPIGSRYRITSVKSARMMHWLHDKGFRPYHITGCSVLEVADVLFSLDCIAYHQLIQCVLRSDDYDRIKNVIDERVPASELSMAELCSSLSYPMLNKVIEEYPYIARNVEIKPLDLL